MTIENTPAAAVTSVLIQASPAPPPSHDLYLQPPSEAGAGQLGLLVGIGGGVGLAIAAVAVVFLACKKRQQARAASEAASAANKVPAPRVALRV